MGNVISRCTQNLRNTLRSCSKKQPEDEAMLNTCDSEPLDRCQESLFDPVVVSDMDRGTGRPINRTGSQSSLVRLQEKMETVNCKLLSSPPKSNFKFCSPHHHLYSSRGYETLVCSEYDDHVDNKQPPVRSFVDRESQTNVEGGVDGGGPAHEPCILSKEYIVKTYSIQNATPSPSPATQTKFPSENHSASSQQSTQPSGTEQEKGLCSSKSGSPLQNLERRQDDVLKKLEQLQSSVSKLSQKYNISTLSSSKSTSVTTASTTTVRSAGGQTCQKPVVGGGSILDLVINVDPSSLPLSLVILCEQLDAQFKVLKNTFIHSSVSDSVPEKLQRLLVSNGGLRRGDCDVAITLVWKKVPNGPELIVDPSKQSTIQGETNVARYLTRLLYPSLEEDDIIVATQTDELLDLAQLQLLEGNSKEKAAAVRTLNSSLGKKDWLVGKNPSLADIVCWSALNQTGQTTGPPANVKRWLSLCKQHSTFQKASGLLS